MDATHGPGECCAYCDLEHRQRHPHKPRQSAGYRHEDQHDEDEDGDLHGTSPVLPDHAQNAAPIRPEKKMPPGGGLMQKTI